MSEPKVFCCPNCGAERKNNGSVFCENCGIQLIDVGGRPGALSGPVHSPRSRRKNNAYAKMRSVGYSTWWQTEGTEKKILNIIMYILMIALLAAVVCAFTGHLIMFLVLFAFIFLTFITAAVISALRPKNRKQIKENAVVYGGKIDYKRNLRTGEIEDHSEIDIHYKEQDN